VTLFLLIVLPLVALLLLLISSMNNGSHYTPQAYYRRKRLGAPVVFGVDALGPRLRRRLPGELDGSPAGLEVEARSADLPRPH
jgi:hypothetical protein